MGRPNWSATIRFYFFSFLWVFFSFLGSFHSVLTQTILHIWNSLVISIVGDGTPKGEAARPSLVPTEACWTVCVYMCVCVCASARWTVCVCVCVYTLTFLSIMNLILSGAISYKELMHLG